MSNEMTQEEWGSHGTWHKVNNLAVVWPEDPWTGSPTLFWLSQNNKIWRPKTEWQKNKALRPKTEWQKIKR